MPDIEIHGLDRDDGRAVRESIAKLLEGGSYASEVVTMLPEFGDSVIDLSGVSQPFLRIVGSPEYLKEHLGDIRKRLKPLGLDFEIMEITFFIKKGDL